MSELPPPNHHYLSAAIGWLELGNPSEARLELERIDSACRESPLVLEGWWLLHVRTNDWTSALQVAEKEARLYEKEASGWLHRAYALRRVTGGGLEAAYEALRPARERFPKEPVVPYNLACYSCQLGRLDEARQWLRLAMGIRGKASIRTMALQDDDLAPLWPELRRESGQT